MKPMKQWKKSTKWIVGSSSSFILIIGLIFGYYIYKINHAMTTMYQPIQREQSNVPDTPSPLGTKAYLILGTDQRPGDKGRTDGIIIAIINDKTKKISLTSIPRDTYVEIANLGRKDKINAAYPLRGVPSTVATVENFTGIHIDHYVWFNMQGFIKAVDTVGGITLNVDSGPAKAYNLPLGMNVLNGEQALLYTRFRHDINGDFGRNDRQQEALKAFLDESKKIRSPLKVNSLLDILGDDVRTDIPKDELYQIAKQLDDFSGSSVEQIKYNATTGPINGISYVFISDKERERVSSLLKERLNR
ncbi:LCP family protein [Tepidibacillus marianensis]|uniref:LCP family protein n=1 Tax=Tepidibacillus marianensis TaxID=3131995 RepID=UPI0030D0DD7A